MYLRDFVTLDNVRFYKKKQRKYWLLSEVVDQFGTKVLFFGKKEDCNPNDTIRLYFPSLDKIIRKTTDQCRYCLIGYEQHHDTVFKNGKVHIQATCANCHRYLRYVSQTSE